MSFLWRQVTHLTSAASTLTKACLQHTQLLKTISGSATPVNKALPVSFSMVQTRAESSSSRQSKDYTPPSPYKKPGPRRYGYDNKMFGGGVLPRPDTETPLPLPRYNPTDNWAKKRALFGQNDYIDILGNGNVHPVDLMRGPGWLIGFKGNELQRLVRRLRFQGRKIKALYPTRYHQLKKRIKFLYRKENRGRSSKAW